MYAFEDGDNGERRQEKRRPDEPVNPRLMTEDGDVPTAENS